MCHLHMLSVPSLLKSPVQYSDVNKAGGNNLLFVSLFTVVYNAECLAVSAASCPIVDLHQKLYELYSSRSREEFCPTNLKTGRFLGLKIDNHQRIALVRMEKSRVMEYLQCLTLCNRTIECNQSQGGNKWYVKLAELLHYHVFALQLLGSYRVI